MARELLLVEEKVLAPVTQKAETVKSRGKSRSIILEQKGNRKKKRAISTILVF